MTRFLLAALLACLLAPLAAAAGVERVVSPQGIEAWLIEDHSNPLISVAIVPLSWFVLWRTSLGLRMRSVGEHPMAAESLGVAPRPMGEVLGAGMV